MASACPEVLTRAAAVALDGVDGAAPGGVVGSGQGTTALGPLGGGSGVVVGVAAGPLGRGTAASAAGIRGATGPRGDGIDGSGWGRVS